ncbi:MAG TPA: hypothetical protein VFS29_08195 [Motilibacteraceae bacterium]|nr:hypothetical protein [Motilibacteraceae bacterium]
MGADGSTFSGQDDTAAPAQGLRVESSAAEVVDEDADPGQMGQGTASAAAHPGGMLGGGAGGVGEQEVPHDRDKTVQEFQGEGDTPGERLTRQTYAQRLPQGAPVPEDPS